MKRNITTCLTCFAMLAAIFPHRATAENKPRVIRMTVSPAQELSPALKYRFRPRTSEHKSGNAALLYYRMIDRINGKDDVKRLAKWLDTPLNKLPHAEARKMLQRYSTILKETELAAHRKSCHWELPFSEEGIETILPPLNKFRHLSKILALRARIEIAEGQYDKAVGTLRTGFLFARHISDVNFLITGLVAMSITQEMLQQVRAFSQAPGAPSLYWAMATLGGPVIDIRKSMENECGTFYIQFPALRDVKQKGISPDDFHAIIRKQFRALGYNGGTVLADMSDKLTSTFMGMTLYPHAKKHLAATGYSDKQIDAMPVAQAIGIYMIETSQRLNDDLFKWMLLPYHEGLPNLRRSEALRSDMARDPAMFHLVKLLPAVHRAYFMQAQLDRRVAAMRTIEAVRLYAGKHAGKLPAKLDDIKIAPVPLNSVTGRPFAYKLSGRTFTLIAEGLSGMKASDTDHYEITLTEK
jgi:hypothetical protein